MNQLILLFSLLHYISCYVEAQSSSPNLAGNIESVAAVIVFLVIVFLVLVIYIKFWHRIRAYHSNQEPVDGLIIRTTNPRSSGIDKIVIESLPFFKFSALKGLRGGLECAVCLSKFEEIEILRLLPKCKHAFHINCVDKWLENHSSCPLCRERISVEDLTYSNSLRLLSSSQSDQVREGSNVELFVQREDSRRHESSRFSLKEDDDQIPIRKDTDVFDEHDKFLHKFNHKIIMSDSVQKKMSDIAVMKTGWSNLSSSDLRHLNSEILGHDVSSSYRFSPLNLSTQEATEEGGIVNIEDRKGMNFGKLGQNDSNSLLSGAISLDAMRKLHPNEKRSMSEIAVHSRFEEFDMSSNGVEETSITKNATKEERLKRLWMPIARKTLQSYGSRDKKYQQYSNYT